MKYTSSTGKIIEVIVKESARRKKGYCLKIQDEKLVVLAPASSTKKDISSLLLKYDSWINEKMVSNENSDKVIDEDNNSLLMFGRTVHYMVEYSKLIHAGGFVKHSSIEDKIYVACPIDASKADIKQLLTNFLSKQAEDYLVVKTMHYAKELKLFPKKIMVRNQKSRWGSCDAKNNLRFNWNIIKFPPEIIDYVIIHELCHIAHKDHSKDFWNAVKNAMPDYQKSHDYLKDQFIDLI